MFTCTLTYKFEVSWRLYINAENTLLKNYYLFSFFLGGGEGRIVIQKDQNQAYI